MKFQLVSDLHLDLWLDANDHFIHDLMPEGPETLIIAGDLCESAHLRYHSQEIFEVLCGKYQNVIYVAGNHEYYGTDYQSFQEQFKRLDERFDNLFCLENQILVVDGVAVAGTTLWFRNTPMNLLYEGRMRDFGAIERHRYWVYAQNEEAIEFLKGMDDIDLVVTHHLPSYKSVDARYTAEPTNLYFLCDVSDIMLDMGPKVWMHGHTHIGCDYMLGETRVICNPRGYPGENPGEYRPVIIEI